MVIVAAAMLAGPLTMTAVFIILLQPWSRQTAN